MSENNYRSISLNSLENLLVELFWKWLIRKVFSGHWSRFRRIVKQESDSYDLNLFLNSFFLIWRFFITLKNTSENEIWSDSDRSLSARQDWSKIVRALNKTTLISKWSFLTTDKGQENLHTVVLLEIIWIRLIERQSLSIWIQLWNHLMLLLIFAL